MVFHLKTTNFIHTKTMSSIISEIFDKVFDIYSASSTSKVVFTPSSSTIANEKRKKRNTCQIFFSQKNVYMYIPLFLPLELRQIFISRSWTFGIYRRLSCSSLLTLNERAHFSRTMTSRSTDF